MMLNLMEAVDPLGGDYNEDINNHAEGRPNLSTFQFTTQHCVRSLDTATSCTARDFLDGQRNGDLNRGK